MPHGPFFIQRRTWALAGKGPCVPELCGRDGTELASMIAIEQNVVTSG
jgi:hypothetical protein